MRQKVAMLITAVVIVVLVLGVGIFAVLRAEPATPAPAPAAAAPVAAQPAPAGAPAQPALSGALQDGVRVVKVRARKFEYIPSKIFVNQGEKVRLEVTSEDVTHGFGLDAYKIDRNLEPNKTAVIEFTADKPGEFPFYCSVFCGSGHMDMKGSLTVLAAGK